MSHVAAQLFDIHVPIYLGTCLKEDVSSHPPILTCLSFTQVSSSFSLTSSPPPLFPPPLLTLLFCFSSHLILFLSTLLSYFLPPLLSLLILFLLLRLCCVFLSTWCSKGISDCHYERSQANPFLLSAPSVGEDSRENGTDGQTNNWN